MTERVDRIVAELTLDEKASLTAGIDMWSTAPVERLGIPAVTMTDGPSGARGTALFGAGEDASVCVPCGSALGATWDPALLERVGAMLGEETRTKACRVLLAPTVNLHRSPTAGRNFECYSEDPLLAGKAAAAVVRGVQSQGVAATVKHFVGNEAEFERNTVSSVIDPRTLRELYLRPFELAVREGGALGIMTGYNRVNGIHNSEHGELLCGVLRGEWGFEGFVVTDWHGALSTERGPVAGVDLEMPGPARAYGAALADAVRDGRVDEARLDDQVRHLLSVFERIGALDASVDAPASIDRPEHRALARDAAIGAIVLLDNDGVLPLDPSALRTLAVIGPNAEAVQVNGGGSAALTPHPVVSPLAGLRARLGDSVAIVHARGCTIDATTPPVGAPRITTLDGRPGFAVEEFADEGWSGDPVGRRIAHTGLIAVAGTLTPDDLDRAAVSLRATGVFTPDETGPHTFGFVQILGGARVAVDGQVVFDGIADPPPPGTELHGMGSEERTVTLDLVAGEPVTLTAEFRAPRGLGILRGVKVGCRLPEPDDLMERAVAAAAGADAAVVVVGTNADWESEGHDRETMALPGRQEELIRRVCAANPRTVVVLNTGSPVTLDWADDAAAVLQTWLGGQEIGNALAAVLVGDADPGGRLPTTVPLDYRHTPAFGHFPGENSEVRYAEGLFMGYRWYDSRGLPVRYPFGHGLSYTTFAIASPDAPPTFAAGDTVAVEVAVTNTGGRPGAEVVQCYVEPVDPIITRPSKELKAFAKVHLAPGESTTVRLELDARAFAYWDPGDPFWASTAEQRAAGVVTTGGAGAPHRDTSGWYVDPGEYRIHIGRSVSRIDHTVTVRCTGHPDAPEIPEEPTP